jgi:meso-butanediol dehydrogenase / (S,S)-butanediol dehydrogenase / diacetyl reductase
MDADFAGRVAVVTGGASGMGAATAGELVGRGAHVIIVDRNGDLAGTMAASLGQEAAMVGDISDSTFCDAVVAEAVRRHGRLDVVVNAAGVIVRARGEDTTDAQWAHIMGVNVSGTFFMCRAAIAAMKANPGGATGAIVNFGSIWGDLGSSGVAAYCASKGAVHNLTRALAMDHATDGIRVNAVCPGEVRTPMLQSERSEPVTQEMLDRIAATVPMGRLAEPIEIARVVAFLASDAASYMTGAMVSVDAGYGAR